MKGWGRSATWPTLPEAVEAAQRAQKDYAAPRWKEWQIRPIQISRSHGKFGGFRFGPGDVVATVQPDGSVRYGR